MLENIRFSVVRPFEPFSFGDYTAVALKAQHSRTECALLYLVEKCGKCYLHLALTRVGFRGRASTISARICGSGAEADLVSFDCTFLFFGRRGIPPHGTARLRGHARGVPAPRRRGENTRWVITHFSTTAPLSENLRRAEEEYSVEAARDGFSVEI
ncbi:MAG: hypothetical protein ACLRSW_11540 [Christensenellaceae bacterium]